jgi:uncharacterized membrane protein
MKKLSVGLLIFLAMACSSSQEQQQEVVLLEDESYQLYEGIFVFGSEVYSFRPCDEDKAYWIEGDRDEMIARYKESLSFYYPFEPAFAMVKGWIGAAPAHPPGSDYAGTLHVVEVVDVGLRTFFNPCTKYDFYAVGNEPNWSVLISKQSQRIEYRDYSTETSFFFPYIEPTQEGTKLIYYSKNERDLSISITISPESCSDGMSDLDYSYSAKLEFGSETRNGCARDSGERALSEG